MGVSCIARISNADIFHLKLALLLEPAAEYDLFFCSPPRHPLAHSSHTAFRQCYRRTTQDTGIGCGVSQTSKRGVPWIEGAHRAAFTALSQPFSWLLHHTTAYIGCVVSLSLDTHRVGGRANLLVSGTGSRRRLHHRGGRERAHDIFVELGVKSVAEERIRERVGGHGRTAQHVQKMTKVVDKGARHLPAELGQQRDTGREVVREARGIVEKELEWWRW